MTVLQLVQRSTAETVQALEYLAEQARRGNIIGVAICYRSANGCEEAAFTGPYKAHPEKAVNAAMRLSWKLTQMQDELAGPP